MTVHVHTINAAAGQQLPRKRNLECVSDEFTIADLRQAVPGASDSYLNKTTPI